MKKITVLGCGMVGSAIAMDLSINYHVTVADSNSNALEKFTNQANCKTQIADLKSAENIRKLTNDSDLVINALPGSMGFAALKQIILAGKDVVDISFFPEDAFELHELALKNNVTAVTDAGVAPGMSNMICGYHNAQSKVSDYKCYVGGLPFVRQWPNEYKAPFSPSDVIEEYMRPARYVQNGEIIIRKALSEKEYVNFEQIGTLEAFNTDGLRTLIKTMSIPDMIEKTMRYPGTAEKMEILREMGFFAEEEITVNNQKIKPLDFTSSLLFPQWKLGEQEKEFTAMRVTVNCEDAKYTYELFDVFDTKSNTSSMARTTGYTCTAVANLLLNKMYTDKGIIPPETLAAEANCFNYILKYQKERGIHYTITRKEH